MLGKHVVKHLSAYLHGELTAADRNLVQTHLDECAKCRAAYEEIRFGARLMSAIATKEAPKSIWFELKDPKPAVSRIRWTPIVAVAALIFIAVAMGSMVQTTVPQSPSWEVASVEGSARIGNTRTESGGRLHPGEALQTDAVSQAQIKIANIGQLTIDPDSRIRLLVTRPDEHRIALDRGKLEARTWAPPRLFVVDTPSARAVDLGCQYTLEVQKDGSSLLHVTLGLVSLERDHREVIVPAGAFCLTRTGHGPGTPYFDDASPAFKKALAVLGMFENDDALAIVLREARIRDGLSLWHLIPRLREAQRRLAVDRLAELLPPPAGVTKEGIVALDPQMLESWKQVVSQLW